MPVPRRSHVVAASLVLAACGDSPTEPGRGTPAAIIVEGGTGIIAVGDTATLTARVVDAGGRALATPAIAWSSLDTAVARIGADGRVIGHDAGTVGIVARAGDIADTVVFQVEVQARRLEIVVSGWGYTDTSSSVIVGNSVTLRPVLLDGRGRLLSSNAAPTFTVDDTTLASAPSYTPSSGYASSASIAAGRATYTVRMAGLEGRTTVKFGLVPVAVRSLALAQLALGAAHACGLDAAGAAQCWGRNYAGQLGRPTPAAEWSSSIGAVSGAPAFASIAARAGGSCGITAERRLWCWGSSALPERTPRATPILEGVDVAEVAIGVGFGTGQRERTCARTTGGEVWCWGTGGTAVRDTAPVRLATTMRFTQIGTGYFGYGCGLLATGRVACWPQEGGAPAEIVGSYGALDRISVGYNGGCGLSATGQAWCWEGAGNAVATPVQTAERFVDIGKGRSFTCGLTAAGQVWCWGIHPNYSQTSQYWRTLPVRIARDESFRAMLVSDEGVCGVREDGDLRCEGFYVTPVLP